MKCGGAHAIPLLLILGAVVLILQLGCHLHSGNVPGYKTMRLTGPNSASEIDAAAEGLKLTFHIPFHESPDNGCEQTVLCSSARLMASSAIGFCASDAEGYMLFIYAMIMSPSLESKTNIRMAPNPDPFTSDIVVCSSSGIQQLLADDRFHKPRQIVAVESDASATVLTPKETVLEPRVLAVLKPQAYKDRGARCQQGSLDRHVMMLHAVLRASHKLKRRPSKKEVVQLLKEFGCEPGQEEAQKVMVGLPLSAASRPLETVRPTLHRPVDVVVACPGGLWPLEEHCRRLRLILDQLQERHPKWKIVYEDAAPSTDALQQLLGRSKLFLSAWGPAERGPFDELAVVSGAVLVKPMAEVEAAIEICSPQRTCLDVSPDWIDLDMVLTSALRNPGRLGQMQQAALQEARGGTFSAALENPKLLETFATILGRV